MCPTSPREPGTALASLPQAGVLETQQESGRAPPAAPIAVGILRLAARLP